jgi:hypothetical protein
MTRSHVSKKVFPSRSAGISLFFSIMTALVTIVLSSAAHADNAVLSWDQNSDADYYLVYVRGDNETGYTQVSGPIPSGTTTFQLKDSPSGSMYHYSVKAFNSCGNSTEFSEEISSAHVPYTWQNSTTDEGGDSPVDQDQGTTPDDITQPMTLEIILPDDGSFGLAGSAMEFSANVLIGGVVSTEHIVSWSSSIDGCIGTGLDITAFLSPGVHIIMGMSTDITGETVSSTIVVYVQEVNTAPAVAITEFAGGTSGAEGQVFSFSASASDAQDGDLGPQIIWISSIDGRIGTGSSIRPTLSPGAHTVTAQVTDSKGVTVTASVDVESVAYNACPVVTILEPVRGDSTAQGLVTDLYGNASDLEDGDVSGGISWTSSISGALGKGAHIRVVLPAGNHVITAKATDGSGKEDSDTLAITVSPYNYPPELTVSHTALGTVTENGLKCTLSGRALDTEDGNISSSIRWSSSLDGDLGGGASVTVTLSPGNHTVTGTVTDSQGKSTVSRMSISTGVYNHPPVLTLNTANAGVLGKDGQNYTFSATAVDTEDGDISAYIVWESDIDGYIGTGASIAACLGSGLHTITLSISDSKGETVSAAREINVGVYNTSPTLTMGPHVPGELSSTGQIFQFNATAGDEEDGSLNSVISWRSSLDGYLGTGPSITTALRPGSHVITASVNDSLGKTAEKTIELTVSQYNYPPSVTITGSTPGALGATGQNYGFTATANDPEDGNIGSSISWTSSRDGSLGVGPSIQTALSPGVHTITAKASDSKGKEASSTVQVTVSVFNAPPSLSITTATPGTLGPGGQSDRKSVV